LRTGISVRDREVVIGRPDGSQIIALVNIKPLEDDVGTIRGAVSCFQDITAQRRIEEELRTSREDLEDFVENAVVGMHWVSADGTILRANQAELDLLGYSRKDYVGHHIAEFHADAATIDDITARLARGESLDKYPARLRARDGEIKHVLISSSARFRDGKLVNTRCVTLDVTALQRAEATRRENERRFRELLGALPVAVYTTDASGRITYYNEAAAELWGHRPELGKSEFCGSWR
jgi:PAS domain S-box-containing protein